MKSTKPRYRKPRPDFPLFPHATGRWAKKVRGKLCYFGKIADDPLGEAALSRWLDERDDLLAGRTPRRATSLTVKQACDAFLEAREEDVKRGDLSPSTWGGYFHTCKIVAGCLGRQTPVDGLAPDDFRRLRRDWRGAVGQGISRATLAGHYPR